MPNKILHNGKFCLELEATNESLKVLSESVSLIAKKLAIEPKIERQLLIVVDEIFSNIVKYANLAPASLVKVDIALFEGLLELKFIDEGTAYNPLKEAPTPDINASIEERAIGGLGIFMVKKMMDVVEYQRYENSNILILKKSFKPSS